MPWSSRVLLAVVTSQIVKMASALSEGGSIDDDDLEELIIEEGRWQWSYTDLIRDTGLSRAGIIDAKRWLSRHGIVKWTYEIAEHGGHEKDYLRPNPKFAIHKRPAKQEGYIIVTMGVREGVV